ncbi:uncharacterized protein LOC115318638 [Ixodes scapularis]|uniref:uncharacterized protein LOC115318638 n=1 Tax=Ixodes scapularis TaxID=6945 RepID=UPI001A9F9B74|nr:uncharacterized protein LOC115318638 [Ixodes scapularis]
MKYAISLSVVVFSAVFNPASASDPSCINVSLSNVLGLGDCLGTSGDLCTGNQDGALNYIGKLAECVLEGTENLDLGTQGYIILQLLEATLQRNGLEVLLSPIKLVCDYINVDCSVLNLNTNAVCGDPIVVNLPSALNIGQCLGNSTEICAAGQPVDESAVKVLVELIKCMLDNLSKEDLQTVLKNSICSLLNILAKLLGGNVISGAVVTGVNAVLGTHCT